MSDKRAVRDLLDTGAFRYGGGKVLLWDREAWTEPSSGDRVSLHDFVTETYFGSGRKYLRVPFTLWGDYVGSAVDRANFEVLAEEYGDEVIVAHGDHGSHAIFLPYDAEISDGLFDTLAELSEYPIIDEEALSDLEFRLEREDWESWGADDFRREIERHLEQYADNPDEADRVAEWITSEWCETFFQGAMQDGHVSYETETAVGGYWLGMIDVAESAAEVAVDEYRIELAQERMHTIHPDQFTLPF